jgi:hypothetical protein
MAFRFPVALAKGLGILIHSQPSVQGDDYVFTERQVNAILDLRLYQLTALENDKISDEYKKLLEVIEDYLDMVSGYLVIIGALLIFNGLVLMISDKLSRGNKTLDELKPKNALLIGLCQAVALLPGISRSGSTITGGLLNGLERPDAVRFSFLLSIPAILGASVLKLPDFFAEIPDSKTLMVYIVGAAVSAVVSTSAVSPQAAMERSIAASSSIAVILRMIRPPANIEWIELPDVTQSLYNTYMYNL